MVYSRACGALCYSVSRARCDCVWSPRARGAASGKGGRSASAAWVYPRACGGLVAVLRTRRKPTVYPGARGAEPLGVGLLLPGRDFEGRRRFLRCCPADTSAGYSLRRLRLREAVALRPAVLSAPDAGFCWTPSVPVLPSARSTAVIPCWSTEGRPMHGAYTTSATSACLT